MGSNPIIGTLRKHDFTSENRLGSMIFSVTRRRARERTKRPSIRQVFVKGEKPISEIRWLRY